MVIVLRPDTLLERMSSRQDLEMIAQHMELEICGSTEKRMLIFVLGLWKQNLGEVSL